MNILDRAGILEFHRERAAEHGDGTVESLGWLAPGGQRRRFEVLAGIADLGACSVLDVGCGHGDLSAFLREKFAGLRYCGIDHHEPFLEVATGRYGSGADTRFLLGDFTVGSLPDADYVLACGALSYRSRDPDFLHDAIARLFGSCRRGLAFTLLREVDERDSALVAHRPEEVFEFCRGLSPEVRLIDDYLPEDFAIYLYRK